MKNDLRDATDLADLLRMGRLPEAWIAPPATRELRELVRHRAKLVGLRSHCKVEIHAVLAKCGLQVLMSDLFSPAGEDLLDRCSLPGPYAARVQSLRRLILDIDIEIDLFTRLTRGRLAASPDYVALQQLPGIGPVLGAVLLAEVGDVTRFANAAQLACWAGLTPKHHESDTKVRRGGSPSRAPAWSVGPQSSRSRRWVPPPWSAPTRSRSPAGAGKTSAPWRLPASRPSSRSTPYVTTTSGPSTHPSHRAGHRAGHRPRQRERRHERLDPDGRPRGRAGHDPHPGLAGGNGVVAPSD